MIHVSLKRLSLRVYLFILIFIPVILLSFASLNFILDKTEKRIERNLKDQVKLVAESLQSSLVEDLVNSDYQRVVELLSSAEDIKKIYSVSLYGSDEKLLWSNKSVLPQINLPSTRLSRPKSQEEYTRVNKNIVYSYSQPLINPVDETLVGTLHLTRKKSNIAHEVRSLKRTIIISQLLTFFVILIITLVVYNKFFYIPLRNITEKISQINLGNLKDLVVSSNYPQEFDMIQNALTSLGERLEKQKLEIKKQEQRGQVLKKYVEQSKRLASIGTLSAGVAHDLGTPLSVVDAAIYQLKKETNSSPKAKEYIDDIAEESKRMQEIIRELLNFSGNNFYQYKKIELESLLNEIINSFKKSHFKDFNIELKNCDVDIWADEVKLRQVLVNIIGNALEVTNKPDIKEVRVSSRLLKRKSRVEISIEDNGPGIEEENIPYIYDPFFSTRKSKKNKGLGLAICHGIVEAHGGTIKVEVSDKLHGAKFIIDLPRFRHE